jgi:hypothetical protein
VLQFWDIYWDWSRLKKENAASPIINKLGTILANKHVRAIFDKPKGLNLRNLMDQGGVMIADLAKGDIGEDAARLVAALLISGFQQAALSRTDTPEAERQDFTLYIDEVQSFATNELMNILSESRKYRLNLVLANQFLGQFEEENPGIVKAILGNVGTMAVFRVGPDDAEVFAKQFYDGSRKDFERWVAMLSGQPNYEFSIRMPIDGAVARPFAARMLKPVA